MGTTLLIDVAKDFSPYLGGRYVTDGPNSGERFRREVLMPNLQKGNRIILDFRGTLGTPSTFMEEAFGGLYREPNFEFISRLIEFHDDPENKDVELEAVQYMIHACTRKSAEFLLEILCRGRNDVS